MQRVDIFWTGGLDSSYRICELSFLEVEIQAHYMIAKKKSVSNELQAIKAIREHLEERESTKCRFLPLLIFNQEEIIIDEEVSSAYRKVCEINKIGTQYKYLSQYARQENLSIELGIEHQPNSKVEGLFEKYGSVEGVSKPIKGGGFIKYQALDKVKSEKFLCDLYGNFRFPLPLFQLTKLQVIEAYKKLGFEELIPMTWFCAHPIFKKPCGICTPCTQVMETGIAHRIPQTGRLLYRLLKANSLGRKMDKKLKKYYNRYWR
ncbi:MAG: hypothetical protein P1P86_12640 [Bacteroidales bacterium]|nr:hypothetical protein [Bacteroidales bacterium]